VISGHDSRDNLENRKKSKKIFMIQSAEFQLIESVFGKNVNNFE